MPGVVVCVRVVVFGVCAWRQVCVPVCCVRSVVFVNDEDVGGRRGVVRVGGVDVGALRRDLNGEENGMTMMMLQIVDANESQNWINAIKNAVLGQRCAFTWPLVYARRLSHDVIL